MSSFTAPLILEATPLEQNGRGVFSVYEAFVFEIGHLGSGEIITVPKGFQTDLASIPAFARPFIPMAGRIAKPALMHDYLLVTGDPRAHDVFDEALEIVGFGYMTRALLVNSVRLWWKLKRFLA